MKRKFWYVFAALVCGTACAFTLAACVAGNNGTHTHNWSSVYTADGDRHYQTCDGCDEKLYGEHDYGTDGVCVCGAAEPVDGHSHNYEWVDNGDGTHKQHCSVSGCPHPDVNVGSHDYGVNGVCVCGAVKPSDTHTQYNVIFNANGGKIDGKDTKTVVGAVNQTVSRPNDPVRTDYTFTGWYKDGATTTPWNFDTDTVKGATTLYAGWQMNVTEYDVTFVHNYPNSANVVKTTENGLITYIPKRTGYIFNGWWYSDGEINGNYILSEKFDTAEKVTRSGITLYAEWVQQRTDNSQLYSPSVSISADGVFSWQAVTGAQGYRVDVYSGSSKTVEETTAKTSWTFPNGSAAGYYTVKIRANGNGENTINSAYTEKYYAHHMLGYVDWRFNNATSIMTWDAVKNATAYEIRINNTLKDTITYTTYDLSALDAGDYTVSVKATRKDWQSATPIDYTLTKKRLRAPNVTVTQNSDCTYTVSWKAVAKADTYRIKHHDTYITVTETSYTVNNDSPIYNANGAGEFTVCAYDSNADYFISDDSESFEIKKLYSLTLEISDERAGAISTPKQYYKIGESVSILATNNSGFTWLGWFNGDLEISKNLYYTFNMPNKNTTLTAKFEIDLEIDSLLDAFTYTSTSTTLIITGVKDMSVTNLVVPANVTAIQKGAFSGCSSLESITLPFVGANKTDTSVSRTTFFGYIFGENPYTGSVETLQYYTIYFDTSYMRMEYKFYIPSSLKSVTIMGGNLFEGAFRNCNSLTSITLPNGLTSIGAYAFENCNSIENIRYTGDIAGWCNIRGLGNLMLYAKSDKTLTINGKTISDKIVIPDSVTSISSDAFYECSNLTSISIPNSVTSIGGGAFYGCSGLTSITIPNSVTSIGSYAFYGCGSLTNISIPYSVNGIGAHAFYGCSNLDTVYWNTDAQSVVQAPNQPIFDNCTKLTTVVIGANVTCIANYVFDKCSSLTNITIPKSVTSIGYRAFRRCSSLTSITIPDSVTSISSDAFYECSNLTSIIIPNSVSNIWDNAFYGCSKLTIYCEAANKPSGWRSNWNSSNCTVVWDYKNK